VNVTFVCGPPLSGKSTYVRERWKDGDLLWDQDLIMQAITGRSLHESSSPACLNVAVAMRTGLINALRSKGWHTGHVWIIVGAPKRAQRELHRTLLGAETVVLKPSVQECCARAHDRPSDIVSAIYEWFDQYEQDGISIVLSNG
jgi:predicted kinase